MNSKLASTIALLALISCSNACKLFKGTRAYPLAYANTKDPQGLSKGTFYFDLEFPITYNSKEEGAKNPNYKFRPDIGVSQVFHGIKSAETGEDWGITCSGDAETNCEVTNKEAKNYQSYYGYQFYWMPGTTQFSLDGDKPDVSKPGMDIALINSPTNGTKWQFHETGILGLSPKSPFWPYLFNQYLPLENSLAMSYHLNTDDSNYWYELYDGDYSNVYHGSVLKISEKPEDLLDFEEELEWAESPDNGFWGIKDAKLWISSNMTAPIHEGDACISSTSPNYFISDKFNDLQILISNIVCGSDECGQNDNYLTAPEIYLTYKTDKGTKKLTITPQDYIYRAKGGNVVPSFDDMSAYQKDSCPINATFGLGRMFLFKRLVVLKLLTDKDRSKITPYVGVYDYSTRPSLAKQADVQNLVWTSVGALIAITIFVFILRAGGNSEAITVKQTHENAKNKNDDEEEEKFDLGDDDDDGIGA